MKLLRILLSPEKIMNNPYVIELIKNGNNEIFRMFPQLLNIVNGEVFINKNLPFSGQVEFDQTDLFDVKSHGFDWSLEVGLVKQSDFASREEFEEALNEKELRNESYLGSEAEKLPIREAFKQLRIYMRMRKGLCENEEEKEEERFNLEMIKIFGEDKGDEIEEKTMGRVCNLSKFRFINKDGNFYYATAVRGIYYLFFVSIN